MTVRKVISTLLFYPISKVYGWVVAIRNAMFDRNVMLHQRKFDIPVIVVGNISMGGSGKTPHTEYIVDSFASEYRIGVLSRGYRRSTRGFVMAGDDTLPEDIGDEPFQIYSKYAHRGVRVAVCEDRVKGIEMMRRLYPDINLMVLDDAFQHRYVKPSLAVVLMEYARPAYHDKMLPYGRLREPMSALNRADVVVITKCPETMTPMESRIIKTNLNLFPYQRLLFSSYRYLPLIPIFPENIPHGSCVDLSRMSECDSIFAVAGVANPRPFVNYLRTYRAKVKLRRYSDHHNFDRSDMEGIKMRFNAMDGRERILVTTEKDAVRMRYNPHFPAELRRCSYYLPIAVDFSQFNATDLAEEISQLMQPNATFGR